VFKIQIHFHTTAGLVQLEEDRQQAEGPSEEERLKTAAANAVRGKAAAARLEATDEAKRMNQMVLYSKCMAVRCASSVLAPASDTASLSAAHQVLASGGQHKYWAQCPRLTGVLLGSGESNKGWDSGSYYVQLVCRHTVPPGRKACDVIDIIRYWHVQYNYKSIFCLWRTPKFEQQLIENACSSSPHACLLLCLCKCVHSGAHSIIRMIPLRKNLRRICEENYGYHDGYLAFLQ
jgi:hypothetical protein